jgi:hypothetical protein
MDRLLHLAQVGVTESATPGAWMNFSISISSYGMDVHCGQWFRGAAHLRGLYMKGLARRLGMSRAAVPESCCASGYTPFFYRSWAIMDALKPFGLAPASAPQPGAAFLRLGRIGCWGYACAQQ